MMYLKKKLYNSYKNVYTTISYLSCFEMGLSPLRVRMLPGIFEYTRLADPRNDIRLMKLRFDRAPRSDSTLSCEIHNFKHKECPPYFALSYAWGQEEFMLSIVVGNTSTLATSSTVHDVLRTLVTARDDNSMPTTTTLLRAVRMVTQARTTSGSGSTRSASTRETQPKRATRCSG